MSATDTHTDDRPVRLEVSSTDYALFNVTYAALVVLFAARARSSRDTPSLAELPVLGLATFALSKAVAREKIGSWVREPLADEHLSHAAHPLQRVGVVARDLVTCTRCIGAWAALGLVALRVTSPAAGRSVATVLAVSGTNDFAQAAFKCLTGRANRTGV
ncbi:MAG: hypothetical protein QOJ13_1224 [Gaiellales bacterium]|nr:hypothetical protein [Gaiellales bacterium]